MTTTPQAWDNFVKQHPRGHFLQLSAWGQLKSAYGWSCDRAIVEKNGQIIAGAQLLFRPLPLRLGTMAYLPYGGYVTDESQWESLWQAVANCAKRHHAAFLKWEAGMYVNEAMPNFAQWGFHESPQRVQPPRTVYIDIRPNDDAIQAAMNQGTRRNVRKAYKNNIRYFEASPTDFDSFVKIMEITGSRNEFGVHTADYYRQMYNLFVPDSAALILAEHEGDILAANFVFQAGKTAVYLVGASANEKRDLMASYGVQWEGIQWAKRRDCHYYDLWGVPDENLDTLEAQFQDRHDGLWGVYRFKRGWGGELLRSAGAWDLVYNPLVYAAYKVALKWRNRAIE